MVDWGSSEDIDFILNYIEMPVNVIYNMKIPAGRLFFGVGPNFSVGLSGKAKSDGQHIDIKFDGKSNGSMDDVNLHMKGLDVGLGLMVGQEFRNGLYATAGYNISLTNIAPEADTYDKINVNGFNIKIGYMLPSVKLKK